MAELRIALLGPPRVERDGAPIEVDTRKAIAMLAYLAIHPERHGRDAVAGLLWPDYDTEHARGALRRTLSTLNKAVGPGWLAADRTTVGFAQTDFWLDVTRFEELLAGCRDHGHPPDDACPACLDPLAEAPAAPGRLPGRVQPARQHQLRRLAVLPGRTAAAGARGDAGAAGHGPDRPAPLGRRGRRRPPLAGPGPAARAGPPPAHADLQLERPARGRPAPVPGLPAGPGRRSTSSWTRRRAGWNRAATAGVEAATARAESPGRVAEGRASGLRGTHREARRRSAGGEQPVDQGPVDQALMSYSRYLNTATSTDTRTGQRGGTGPRRRDHEASDERQGSPHHRVDEPLDLLALLPGTTQAQHQRHQGYYEQEKLGGHSTPKTTQQDGPGGRHRQTASG